MEKISHLKDLGINAVEFLPVQEFYIDDFILKRGLTNYWGYNTIGFFAPESYYSTRASPGCQVKEFKTLVRELHKQGIEVLLDVVYKHSGEGNELGPTLSFRGIDNATYYCLTGPPAEPYRYYMNYTGCGNSLNLANTHVIRFVLDSLRYWVEEMHVGGFRFDLASVLGREDGFFQKSASFFDEAKPSYSLTVQVDDTTVGTTPDASVAFTMNLTDVNEAPTAVTATPNPASLAENTSTVNSVKVADLTITDDALGTNTLSLTGTDAASFVIVGMELHVKAGTTLSYEAKPSYSLTVQVDDTTVGTTPDANVGFTLNLTNVNEAPTVNDQSFAVAENADNDTVVGTIVATDPDNVPPAAANAEAATQRGRPGRDAVGGARRGRRRSRLLLHWQPPVLSRRAMAMSDKRMSRNEKLRYDRLTFYKDDIEKIDKLLAEFLRLSGAKCALLIDKEGHLVTKRGELRTIDIDTISALVAGSFAATKEMARLLGVSAEGGAG